MPEIIAKVIKVFEIILELLIINYLIITLKEKIKKS